MEEIKLRPKGLSMSTEGWRLRAAELPDVNLYIEPEKAAPSAIKTISKKERPKSVEVF